MEQRRPRVGDTLDDYCPRDDQVTTHTVVAFNDDGVTVTRCQTCDAEHEYPGASADSASPSADARAPEGGEAEGSVRRPLIRATLTFPEGTPPTPRDPPVFTMHEQPARGNTRGKQGGRGGFAGNGRTRDGNTQPKKQEPRRGGQGRFPKDPQSSGGQPGTNRAPGDPARPDGRVGSKSRSSSRRGRGRSR